MPTVKCNSISTSYFSLLSVNFCERTIHCKNRNYCFRFFHLQPNIAIMYVEIHRITYYLHIHIFITHLGQSLRLLIMSNYGSLKLTHARLLENSAISVSLPFRTIWSISFPSGSLRSQTACSCNLFFWKKIYHQEIKSMLKLQEGVKMCS